MPEIRDIFCEIRPLLNRFRDEDGVIRADLDVPPNDVELTRKLGILQDQGAIEEIRVNGKLLSIETALSGSVALTLNPGNVPGYFENWAQLIRRHPLSPPADYFVFDKTGADKSSYQAACELLGALKERAEVWDSTQMRLFLVDAQAVEIPITYTAESTVNIAEHLGGVKSFLDDSLQEADSRWNFFRKAAIRAIQDSSIDLRLSVLFEQLGNVFERASKDFSLYLERYSFEDALKAFDEKRLKFIADSNHVLASIQGALLAVPVGFFLIAEKIKQTDQWVGQNIVIGSGGVIFCGILLILLGNQGKTLKEVSSAIDDFGKAQKAKQTPNAPQIEKMVENAKQHSNRIRCFLRIITVLVVLFAVVIIAAVIWASNPKLQKLIPYAPSAQIDLPGKTDTPTPKQRRPEQKQKKRDP